MKTNYGKIAYLKTEEIIKNMDYSTDIDRIMAYAYENTSLVFDTPLFAHTLSAIPNNIISCSVEYSLDKDTTSDIICKMYINNIPVYSSKETKFSFHFVSSKEDNIELYFSGNEEDIVVTNIKLIYSGRLINSLNTDIIYFDDNSTGLVYYRNGNLTKYSTVDEFLSNYKYLSPTNEVYHCNSIVTSTKKTGFYKLYYDDATEYLVLTNISSGTNYNLKQVKPDFAIYMPVSSAQYRVVYALNNKLYYFNTSRNGSNISDIFEITGLENMKIDSLFPVVVVSGNTSNFPVFGVVANGNAYICKYNSSLKTYTSKKYIGKCDYASAYFTNDSISVVLYLGGVATIKTYSDREVVNLVSTKSYYNCYRIFNISGTLLGLNFEGISILNT